LPNTIDASSASSASGTGTGGAGGATATGAGGTGVGTGVAEPTTTTTQTTNANNITEVADLPLGFRFGVFFMIGGAVPVMLDTRFQKVMGLTATIATEEFPEGGQNLYVQRLPTGITYGNKTSGGNLRLKRGMMIGSPLNLEFQAALSLFKFKPSNVIIMLFNDAKVPISSWLFTKAFPVAWSMSDLDINSTDLIIDTLDLAYARMQILRV
jgi:phage tail-like protein